MKIGIPTFGSDGGKSGISRYLISLLREFARIDGPDEYELITYPDEKHLFDLGSPKVQLTCLSTTLRSPARNILWHQTVLPRLCHRRGWDVLFLPAGNRRLPPVPRLAQFMTWPRFMSITSTIQPECFMSAASCLS